jgi:hypothetical protein
MEIGLLNFYPAFSYPLDICKAKSGVSAFEQTQFLGTCYVLEENIKV